MRKPLVAGNWKMNGTRASVAALTEAVKAGAKALDQTDIAVCPPFVFLGEVSAALRGSRVGVGAQDVSRHSSGAFTGEVSAPMLKELGCQYALVGHSERRTYHCETSELVAQKMVAVAKQGMIPVVCVGETLQERESNHTESVIAEQLAALMDTTETWDALRHAVIAYEPVWAIGTGKTATPQQAQEVHAFIRRVLGQKDVGLASAMRILYGGSVKGDNAVELFAMADIDGGLIGGASLKAEEFLAICQAARAK